MKLITSLLLIFVLFFVFSKTTTGQTGPTISNISVSTSGASATITWTTDVPAVSSFDWGVNSEENDFTADNSEYLTSHSVTISSLLASTVYYYKIFNTNQDGYETISGPHSFTSAASSTSSSSSSTTTSSSSPTSTPTPTPKDTTPPTITFGTNFKKKYVEVPRVSGKVTDDRGVEEVEYSLSGTGWFSPFFAEKGAKEVVFSFLPAIFEDGSYGIRVRAKDKADNVGESSSYTLIIDRLPPQVGGSLISIGSQLVEQNNDGTFVTVAGIEHKITLSAVGGPTKIDLNATSENSKQSFTLVKNTDNGLWTGNIKFGDPGVYTLNTYAIDGAKNEVSQEIGKVVVLEGGSISHKAKVTVYYFEPILKQFVLWDAKPFFQQNPQTTSDNHKYRLLLPPGKYFLDISSAGFKRIRTNIFELSKNTPITDDFELKKAIKIGPLTLPFVNQVSKTIKLKLKEGEFEMDNKFSSLIGRDFPQKIPSDIKIVTFVASWHPQTSEQLKNLKGINALAVFSQETEASAQLFKKRGSYDLEVAADPDGKQVKELNIYNLPLHFFLDGKKIKDVKSGILSKEKL